jgi:hypothetical protein
MVSYPMPSSDDPLADIAYRSTQDILGHPRFLTARSAYIDAVLALYEGDTFLTRLVLEAARTVIFAIIISLDARHDESDRATWPTISLLKQQMAQFGLASPRRIEDLVARLIHTGFLESNPAKQDGRVRLLRPADKMLKTDQAWLAAHYLPLDVMFPNPGYPQPMRRDPSFQQAQRVLAIGFLGHGAQIMAGNPAMMLFLARDAGVTILMKLIQIAGKSEGGACELSHEDIGALFGVSRTHVRKILQDAAKQGLIALSGRGHRAFEITPMMWQAFDRFVAESMSGHDLMFEIAMRQMKMAGGVAA